MEGVHGGLHRPAAQGLAVRHGHALSSPAIYIYIYIYIYTHMLLVLAVLLILMMILIITIILVHRLPDGVRTTVFFYRNAINPIHFAILLFCNLTAKPPGR